MPHRSTVIFKSGPTMIVRHGGAGSPVFTAITSRWRPQRFASVREARWLIDAVDADRKARRAQRRARRQTRLHRKFRR